jgi:hypothetical protein
VKNYKSRTLELFHVHGLLSADGMERWFARAARRPADVRAGIEAGHARWLSAVGAAAAALVSETGGDGRRAFRNVLATADPKYLAFWRHAYDLGALSPFGPGPELQKVLDAAERRMPGDRSLELQQLQHLASASQVPAKVLISRFQHVWPVWLALAEQLPARHARRELASIINSLGPFAHLTTAKARRHFDRVMTEVEVALRRTPALRLSMSQALALPEPVKSRLSGPAWLLSSEARKELGRFPSVAAYERDRRARLARSRIQAARRAIESLLTVEASAAAASGRAWKRVAFALRALSSGADAELLKAGEAMIDASVKRRRRAFLRLRAAAAAVRRGVAGGFKGEGAQWLAYAAIPLSERCRVFMPDASAKSGLLGKRITAALTQQAVGEGVMQYLKSHSARAQVWRCVGPGDEVPHDDWNRAFVVRRQIDASELSALLEWLDGCSPAAKRKFERVHGDWMLRTAGDLRSIREMLGTPQSQNAVQFVLGGSSERLRTAFSTIGRADSKRDQGSLRSAIRAMMRRRPSSGQAIIPRLISEGPGSIGVSSTLELIGPDLDVSCLQAMFLALGRDASARPLLSELYLRCMERNRGRLRRAYRRMTRADVPIKATLASSLWAAAMACGGGHALALLGSRPDVFASRAARSVPHEKLLAWAAAGPGRAGVVAGMLSRTQALRALPAARESLADRPSLRAVLELAVLSDLREIRHLRQLARTAASRAKVAAGSRFDDRYRTYTLPKRSGGTRTIAVPDRRLMRLQRRLLVGAFEPIPLHASAHGFRRARGILSNAKAHVGRRLVVNVDIKSFFPSTKHEAVLAACMAVDGGAISVRGAKLLADICCFQGALPTGAPTSPVLGNLVLRRVDAAVSKAARRHGISYTRYADDLTFSGGDEAKRILPFVGKVLRDVGYELDAKKTQLYRNGRQQFVTGLVVNDRANLRRSDRRRLRAAVNHRCRGLPVTWHGRPMSDAALAGRIALQGMIDPDLAKDYRRELKETAESWGRKA